jgi:hypothetical protein
MYNVAEIQLPGGAVFFTCRTDDRNAEQVVHDGIVGLRSGANSPIYHALDQHRNCLVTTIFTGLTESEGKAKQRTLIEYCRSTGRNVLNQRG